MKITVPANQRITALNWDGDLTVPAGKKVEITDSTCVGTALAGLIMTLGGGTG
jgi:hypothetical protein